ncbi:acyl carrier protein [Kibdelosporangium aridum]|uniref:acyl carrier protein n=1 Tax=Kibdelosporangium aridum TaxID=2030 RepID=UPI000527D649
MTISSRDQVAEIVRGFVAGELNIDEAQLKDDTVLKELPGADSVRLLRIVSKLERHCETEFDDEDIFSSTTLDDLVTLVHGYVAAGV